LNDSVGEGLSQQSEKAVSKEDLEAFLRKRVQELEEELRTLKALLEYIEDAGKLSPTRGPRTSRWAGGGWPGF